MSVNGVPVTRSEFVLSYHQNNGNGQADRKTVEEYAELYAIYKMKVAAALDARLDTSAAFRQEARQRYDRTKRAIGSQGLIRPAEIFLRLSTRASDREQNRIAQRADSIWRALQAGADFAALARKFSDDRQSANHGGEMGWLQPNQSFVEFEQAAYALQKGELSRPILAPDGYHIILMKERKQLEPFEVLKDDLVRSLQQQEVRRAIAGQTVREGSVQQTKTSQKDQTKAYSDGLLVYEITNREVWQRAKTDEIGLRAWFDAHEKTYVSTGPHYRGVAYATKTKADMKAVKKYLKRLPFEQWEEALRATFNSDGEERVKLQVGDVRAQVVADYQLMLETEWVASLRSRYPVQINQEILKTVNQYQ